MLELIITSSILILALILIRALFRGKINRRLRYAMWALALLRLIIPVTFFSSPLSVMNIAPGLTVASGIQAPYIPDTVPGAQAVAGPYENDAVTPKISRRAPIENIVTTVWLCGAVGVALWFIGVNAFFYMRLRKARRAYEVPGCRLTVYFVELDISPCMFGLLKPAVYLTPKALESGDRRAHVLMHELTHYRHLDHVWALLRGACLAAYWFNPLVWIAAWLSRCDGEEACDEAVVALLGEDRRIEYGRTLVDMVSTRRSANMLFRTATTMAAGKNPMERRIKMIAANKKTVLSALAVMLLLIAVAVAATFSGASANKSPEPLEEKLRQGLESEDPVLSSAWELIKAKIEQHEQQSLQLFGDEATAIEDAKITRLEKAAEYEDIYEERVISAYYLEYRLLPGDMSKIMLAGGTDYDDEGWLTEAGSMGPPCLIADSSGGETTVLGTVYPARQSLYAAVLEFLQERDAADGLSTAEFALKRLEASFALENGALRFHLPELPASYDWNIWISGRIETEMGGMSVHLFTEESENKSWSSSESYVIETQGKNYTELIMSVSLPDGKGGAVEREYDLIAMVNGAG